MDETTTITENESTWLSSVGEKIGSAAKSALVYIAFAAGGRVVSQMKRKVDQKLEAIEIKLEKEKQEKEAQRKAKEEAAAARKAAGLPAR